MKRVLRGDSYYYFHQNSLRICVDYDFRNAIDDARYEIGNYFHTKEEAEEMVEKIRKVLNGAWVLTPPEGEIFSRKVEAVLNDADVIEMPSEEDASFESVHHLRLSGHDDRDRREEAYLDGFADCLHWLKSKIVK